VEIGTWVSVGSNVSLVRAIRGSVAEGRGNGSEPLAHAELVATRDPTATNRIISLGFGIGIFLEKYFLDHDDAMKSFPNCYLKGKQTNISTRLKIKILNHRAQIPWHTFWETRARPDCCWDASIFHDVPIWIAQER